MSLGTCEVCQAPATVAVADLQELPPVYDSRGQGYRRWKAVGSHAYCGPHARPGRSFMRDGTVRLRNLPRTGE